MSRTLCPYCGERSALDTCLDVACPQCGAKAGTRCKRPSEHRAFGGTVHLRREVAALHAGRLHLCDELRRWCAGFLAEHGGAERLQPSLLEGL